MSQKGLIVSLLLIALAGSAPFIFSALDSSAGDGTLRSGLDAFLLKREAPIVFGVLFVAGVFAMSKIGNPIWGLALLPPLVAAIFPLIRGPILPLSVPLGAVVAFEASYSDDDALQCPPGWQYFSDLAGRFPLGAGEGAGLQVRTLTDPPGGREEVQLERRNLPDHTHDLPSDRGGSGNYFSLINTGNSDEQPTGDLTGGVHDVRNDPFQIMPPYQVVLYCQFTGEEEQSETTDG